MKGALAVVLPVYREVWNRRCCAGLEPPKACDGKRPPDAYPGGTLRPAALAEVPRACYDERKARPAALMKTERTERNEADEIWREETGREGDDTVTLLKTGR